MYWDHEALENVTVTSADDPVPVATCVQLVPFVDVEMVKARG
jgi:hypothetical protein